MHQIGSIRRRIEVAYPQTCVAHVRQKRRFTLHVQHKTFSDPGVIQQCETFIREGGKLDALFNLIFDNF